MSQKVTLVCGFLERDYSFSEPFGLSRDFDGPSAPRSLNPEREERDCRRDP
jgi:hypothetical protein